MKKISICAVIMQEGRISAQQMAEYNEVTVNDNPAGYWADISNSVAVLSSSLARDRVTQRCLKTRGWVEQTKGGAKFWEELREIKPNWVDIDYSAEFDSWLRATNQKVAYVVAAKFYESEKIVLIME